MKSIKYKGTVLLNAILIFTLAMMVIFYSTQKFQESVNNYQLLDEKYRHEIIDELHVPNELKFLEYENA